jgi:hypothetical protein
MSSRRNSAQRKRVRRQMQKLLASSAFYEWDTGPFTLASAFNATELTDLGILSRTGPTPTSEELIRVLSIPQVPGQRNQFGGPLLCAKVEGGKDIVMQVRDCLARKEPEVRKAVAKYFSALPEREIAPRTRSTIRDCQDDIASSKLSTWKATGQKIDALLRNDIYLTLSGFATCYRAGFEPGLNEFFARLIRPDSALLASVELTAWDPSNEPQDYEKCVAECSKAENIREALEQFYQECGHLPLSGMLGARAVVHGWLTKASSLDLWTDIWAWADGHASPIARYHACCICLGIPSIVPEGLEEILWSEITEMTRGGILQPNESRWEEAWLIREEMAQHLGNHMLCVAPGVPGDRAFGLALWLTERICEIIPPSSGVLKEFREVAIDEEREQSQFIAQLTNPPHERSGLAYLSDQTGRLWSTAMVGEMADAVNRGVGFKPHESDRRRLYAAATSVLLQSYPPPTGNGRISYGFDHPIVPLVDALSSDKSLDAEHKTGDIGEALKMSIALNQANVVAEVLAVLPASDAPIQRHITRAIHSRACTVETTGTELSAALNSRDTARGAFAQKDGAVLSHLYAAMKETAVRDGDPWRSIAPHVIAHTAEEVSDSEQRAILFRMVIGMCIGTGTVSAIDRLMCGSYREEFIPVASAWCEQLRSLATVAPPWAAGRIRAVLPSLFASELTGD